MLFFFYCIFGSFIAFQSIKGLMQEWIKKILSRVHLFVLTVSCVGIMIAYIVGVYVTGPFHQVSQWMGALLSCTSVVIVLQTGNFREALRPAWMRILGTFIGVVIGYVYLKNFHFSLFGMLCAVFLLELLCMLLGIYAKSRIATITLIIILLITQVEPNMDPLTNAALRFFESVAGVGVGVALLWVIDLWNRLRNRMLHSGYEEGVELDMEQMPLRWGHLQVAVVASFEQFMGGALATLVGIVIPMFQLVANPSLSAFMQGLVASMSLIGIMVGSLAIGGLSDRYGYLQYFRLCPFIVLAGAVLVMWLDDVWGLALGLFIMGCGIGGGYSLDSDYISEIMPRKWRYKMVGMAKSSSALGNILMAAACYYLLGAWKSPEAWNKLLFLMVIISAIAILCRIRFAESPGWLMAHGQRGRAERSIRYFLGQDVVIKGEIEQRNASEEHGKNEWSQLLSKGNISKVILSGVPWACEGFGVYGVGVFLPVVIMALGLGDGASDGMQHITSAVKLSVYINLFVVLGFYIGLYFIGRVNHIRQQVYGFVVCAIGLVILLLGYAFHLPHWVMIFGFILYELFMNGGPHLLTYILPPQIYPVSDRGAGVGLAAAFGKIGGIMGVFFVPILLKLGGIYLVMCVTIALQSIGAIVTAVFGRKLSLS